MATSTGYTTPNGPTRKFKAAAQAAVTIGPALIVIVQYLLTLLPQPVPANVAQALTLIIEALTILVATYCTAPGAQDVVAPVEQPELVSPAVPPAPVAPQAVYSAVPADAPLAPPAR